MLDGPQEVSERQQGSSASTEGVDCAHALCALCVCVQAQCSQLRPLPCLGSLALADRVCRAAHDGGHAQRRQASTVPGILMDLTHVDTQIGSTRVASERAFERSLRPQLSLAILSHLAQLSAPHWNWREAALCGPPAGGSDPARELLPKSSTLQSAAGHRHSPTARPALTSKDTEEGSSISSAEQLSTRRDEARRGTPVSALLHRHGRRSVSSSEGEVGEGEVGSADKED